MLKRILKIFDRAWNHHSHWWHLLEIIGSKVRDLSYAVEIASFSRFLLQASFAHCACVRQHRYAAPFTPVKCLTAHGCTGVVQIRTTSETKMSTGVIAPSREKVRVDSTL